MMIFPIKSPMMISVTAPSIVRLFLSVRPWPTARMPGPTMVRLFLATTSAGSQAVLEGPMVTVALFSLSSLGRDMVGAGHELHSVLSTFGKVIGLFVSTE